MYVSELQQMLMAFQEAAGETPHVYYQPPENIKLSYPCFIYSFDDSVSLHANGSPYLYRDEYTVTYITKSVSPPLVNSMRRLSKVKYDRHFTSDNLHHYVFTFFGDFISREDLIGLENVKNDILGGTNG